MPEGLQIVIMIAITGVIAAAVSASLLFAYRKKKRSKRDTAPALKAEEARGAPKTAAQGNGSVLPTQKQSAADADPVSGSDVAVKNQRKSDVHRGVPTVRIDALRVPDETKERPLTVAKIEAEARKARQAAQDTDASAAGKPVRKSGSGSE